MSGENLAHWPLHLWTRIARRAHTDARRHASESGSSHDSGEAVGRTQHGLRPRGEGLHAPTNRERDLGRHSAHDRRRRPARCALCAERGSKDADVRRSKAKPITKHLSHDFERGAKALQLPCLPPATATHTAPECMFHWVMIRSTAQVHWISRRTTLTKGPSLREYIYIYIYDF